MFSRIALLSTLVSVILFSSCLDTTNYDMEAEMNEISSYLKKNGFTDEDKISDNIYVKIFSDERTGNSYPANDSVLITSFTSYDLVGNLLNTTDSALARTKTGVYNDYVVYGPVKRFLANNVYGIYVGLSYLQEGDSAVMVLSSQVTGTNYLPVAYHVKVHEIISDNSAWEANQVAQYIEGKEYTEYSEGIYYRKNIALPGNEQIMEYDSASMRVITRYAEQKGHYATGNLGRVCYPLGESDTVINYAIGIYGKYPFCDAIDEIALNVGMHEGEEIEIVTTSDFAYSDGGIVNQNLGNFVVPVYQPLHYIINVQDVFYKDDE